ncbi:MAG: serine protein kinase RIO [Candidatus Nanohaloarchaea archaeon]
MDEDWDVRERWKERGRKMFDSSEARKAFENVFDHTTQGALLKLADRKVLEKLYGTIESGKESLVFLADTPDDRRVLVKIYMTRAGGFRDMATYLEGDKRFRDFKRDRRSVIDEWCKKEYRNLERAREVVKCPEPVAFQQNILVMEFIGEDFSPYPKIKDVEIENPQTGYRNVVNGIRRLWQEQELVHGDLSEYNLLVTGSGELYWIDFSQGVHRTHPEARELLKRDLENVSSFFERLGADPEPEEAYEGIISGEESL